MAEFVWIDAFLSVDGTNLSDHVRALTLVSEAEAVDQSAMGQTTRVNAGGFKTWQVEATFNGDHAALSVDDVLFDIVGTTVPIVIRPTSDVIGATNPEFQGTGLVTSYQPFGGEAGSNAEATMTVVSAGDLVRAVA